MTAPFAIKDDDDVPVAFIVLELVGACGLLLWPVYALAMGAPWTADISVGPEEWSMRQYVEAPWWAAPLRLCAYTRKGATADLIGCEVCPRAFDSMRTQLARRVWPRTGRARRACAASRCAPWRHAANARPRAL